LHSSLILLISFSFEEYVLKSLFIQKIPMIIDVLLENRVTVLDLLMLPQMKPLHNALVEKFENLIKQNNSDSEERCELESSAKVNINFNYSFFIFLKFLNFKLII
jgi:hypothetical protein